MCVFFLNPWCTGFPSHSKYMQVWRLRYSSMLCPFCWVHHEKYGDSNEIIHIKASLIINYAIFFCLGPISFQRLIDICGQFQQVSRARVNRNKSKPPTFTVVPTDPLFVSFLHPTPSIWRRDPIQEYCLGISFTEAASLSSPNTLFCWQIACSLYYQVQILENAGNLALDLEPSVCMEKIGCREDPMRYISWGCRSGGTHSQWQRRVIDKLSQWHRFKINYQNTASPKLLSKHRVPSQNFQAQPEFWSHHTAIEWLQWRWDGYPYPCFC